MLLCGFLGRHKLLWSGLKELKLLLALDTAGGVVGPAGALDNVRAFLRWALRSSHLLTRQGDIPTALFVFTNGAQAPKAPQQPSDLHSWWKVLLWGLLDAVLTQFLGVCSSEGAPKGFSPSCHMWALDEQAPEGRWEVELGCAGRGLVGSVAPSCSTSAARGLGDTWGSPGPSVPSLLSIPPPWHGLAPSPAENTLLCQACSPCPQGMARASITGPDGNFSALFLLF